MDPTIEEDFMTTASSILVLGNDLTLLETRASVLKTAGYNVEASRAGEEMPSMRAVDLLIVCHTLSEAERTAVLRTASAQHPPTNTLCLTPTKGSLEGVVNLFNSYDGPGRLLETVEKLLLR